MQFNHKERIEHKEADGRISLRSLCSLWLNLPSSPRFRALRDNYLYSPFGIPDGFAILMHPKKQE